MGFGNRKVSNILQENSHIRVKSNEDKTNTGSTFRRTSDQFTLIMFQKIDIDT